MSLETSLQMLSVDRWKEALKDIRDNLRLKGQDVFEYNSTYSRDAVFDFFNLVTATVLKILEELPSMTAGEKESLKKQVDLVSRKLTDTKMKHSKKIDETAFLQLDMCVEKADKAFNLALQGQEADFIRIFRQENQNNSE